MFDEERALVREAARLLAGRDPSTCEPGPWRLGAAELRREMDALDAEYGRVTAPVDVSWMAQATGSTIQRARQHAAVGAAIVLHALTIGPPLLLGLFFAAQAGLNIAVMRQLADQPEPGRTV